MSKELRVHPGSSSAYGYFPGCLLRGIAVAYEESLLAVFRLLGLQVEELRDWNCCGATSYASIDQEAAIVLSAANLSRAREANFRELITPCSACHVLLRKTQDYVRRYPQIAGRVERSLASAGLPPLDGVRVRHPLEVLYSDVGLRQIQAKTVREWQGGPVACYYGCQLASCYGGGEGPHNPMRMDELLRAAGIPTVEYALKTKCCGGSLTATAHPVGVRLNQLLLQEAARKGAWAIATACPLCQYNLDAFQREIRRDSGHDLDMPVFFFTQVLGWALGADARLLGLQRCISGRKVIAQGCPARCPPQVESYV